MTQQTPEIIQIDAFRNQFETGNPDEQAAAFYGLAGLARQLVDERDGARQDTDEAMGLVMQAEAERNAALAEAKTRQPVDESEELARLRAQVKELVGQLTLAEAKATQEHRQRVRAEEQLTAAKTDHDRILRAKQRKLDKAAGALAVAKKHICTHDKVASLQRLGVVGTMIIYAHNSAPSQAVNLVVTRQEPDSVSIRYKVRRLKRTGETNARTLLVDGMPGNQGDS